MKRSLPSIQGLRAIAASCVVVSHSILDLFHINSFIGSTFARVAVIIGETGVNVFFSISGFIMIYTSFNAFGNRSAPADFFIKRILRIVPLYLIATGLQFINKYGTSPVYDFRHLLYSVLFIPYIGDDGEYRPVLSQGWTLNLEMFFYLLFALSLFFRRQVGIAFLILILGDLALGDQSLINRTVGISSFYTNSILSYFIVGIIVGIVYTTKKIQSSVSEGSALVLSLLLLFAAVCLACFGNAPLSIASGLLACGGAVYLCATAYAGKITKFTILLNSLGDASYSVYLFHGFLLGAIKHLTFPHLVRGFVSLLAYLGAMVGAANGIGVLIYRGVERHLTRMSKATYSKLRAPPVGRSIEAP